VENKGQTKPFELNFVDTKKSMDIKPTNSLNRGIHNNE